LRTQLQNKLIGTAVLAYILVFAVNFASFLAPQGFFDYLIPILLAALPMAAGVRLNFSFSGRHFIAGFFVSLGILFPYALIEFYAGSTFEMPSIKLLAFQFLAVSIPEEIFFRGFLQQSFGNNYKGILITSLLFSLAHLPIFLFYNNIYALLTFFPSIVMGLLYMKTENIMPCIMFHFLSNILWAGFR
jgi:membrane protease YdiL (CAAX protease family)